MTTYSWIVCGLGAFDVMIVTLWLLDLRSQPSSDRKSRVVMVIAFGSVFIFHAVLFMEGAILYLHLATLAVIFISWVLWPLARQPVDGDRSRTS
jgi:hypothetical protein